MKKENKMSISDIFMIMVAIRTWISISSIITDNTIVNSIEGIFNGIIVVLFFVIFVGSHYTFKQMFIIMLLCVLFLFNSVITNNRMFFLAYLTIIVSKNIDKERLIKLFFITNVSILGIHLIYFAICYFLDPNQIQYMVDDKGIRCNLFLNHPNYAAGVMLWSLAMYIYISKKSNKKLLIILTIVLAFLSYFITKSRTSFIGFVFLLISVLVYDTKHLFNINQKVIKYMFIILAVLNIFVFVNYAKYDFKELNDLFSGRYQQSYVAYKKYGSSLFGQKININDNIKIKGKYSYDRMMLDSFYSVCFINYGYIFLIIIGILSYFYIKKETNRKEIILWGLFSIVCICEKYVMFSTIAFPIILMGRSFLNAKK